MSWRNLRSAFPLEASGAPLTDPWPLYGAAGDAAVWATSTSTALLPAGAWGATERTARVFGLGQGALQVSGSEQASPGSVWSTVGTPGNPWPTRLQPTKGSYLGSGSFHTDSTAQHADVRLTSGGGPGSGWTWHGTFNLRTFASAVSSSGPALGGTSVADAYYPQNVRSGGWRAEMVTGGSTSGWLTTVSVDLYATLKDLHICRVPATVYGPHGGWLLLGARSRVKAKRGLDGITLRPETTDLTATNAIADIIGYFVPGTSPDFDSSAVGPFLVVDSLDALPFSSTQPFRCMCGVPGAAFVEDSSGTTWLMVYYVVEDAWKNVIDAASPSPATFDQVTSGYVQLAHLAYFGGTFADVGRGIAVKRIAASTFAAQVATLLAGTSPPSSEATWTRTDAMAGTLLGKARFWVAKSGTLWSMVSPWETEFGSTFTDTSSPGPEVTVLTTPVATDPSPALCEGQLVLYHARIPRRADNDVSQEIFDGTNGHGIWRAALLPDGKVLAPFGGPSTSITTDFGRDFVVAPGTGSTGLSVDQIVVDGISYTAPRDASGESFYNSTDWRQHLDPDPFELPSGDWCLLAGGQRYGFDPVGGTASFPGRFDGGVEEIVYGSPTSRSIGTPLDRFAANAADACIDWEKAFEAAAGVSNGASKR